MAVVKNYGAWNYGRKR